VRSLERRLENLERLVEGRVRISVREELEYAIDRLEWHIMPEELFRMVRILAGEDDEPQRETTLAHLRTGGNAREARDVVNISIMGVRQSRGPQGV
jgi:hypothetical protein